MLHEFVHQAAISHPAEKYRKDSAWPQLKHADTLKMADAYAVFALEIVKGWLPK